MKTKYLLGLIILGSTLLLCAPALAFGQAVYGSISGTVTDPSGAAVAQAKVTIVDTGKGINYATTTNESGNYSQTHLIVGIYEVRVEMSGFTTSVQQGVTVEVDATTQVNVKLAVGNVGEVVNVTSEVPLLKTERTDVSDAITQKAVQELPTFGRDLNRLYFLVPGIQANSTTAASEQPQDAYRPSIGGQYWGGISFLLDGTDNRESVLGEPVITPNLDALSELKITTTAYDAEFGQASQAVISYQTKSGTNEIHGSAFLFRRSDVGEARDPFSQAQPTAGGDFIPPSLWDQFGGSIGAPIQKDKTFIFGDFQGTAQKNGGSVLTRVPTAAERAGNLSDLGMPIFNPCIGANCNVDPTQRQQFANGIIPTSMLSPQAEALLQMIPMPNIAGATGAEPNYSASGFGIFNSNSFDVRVDRYQSEKLHLFGRYSFVQTDQTIPGAYGLEAGGPQLGSTGFAGSASLRNQSLTVAADYVLRPNWLTDFRFGYLRYRVFVEPNGVGTSPAADAGIPGLNLDKTFTSGLPAFSINGPTGTVSGPGAFSFGYSLGINSCNCPLDEEENEYQMVGNVTHTFRNHQFKFGGDLRFAHNLRVPSDSHRSGELSFNPTTTEGVTGIGSDGKPAIGGGLGLASFLLGDVGTFNRFVSNSTTAAESQTRMFTYAQDTWRVTPKLTLNYGLRWEIYFPQAVNGTDNGGFQDLTTGEVLIAGENGVNNQGNVSTALTHFAPRLGIAYQINPKTVLRAGYGRSYDVGVFGVSFGHNVTQNVPVLAQQSLNPAQPFLSVFNLATGPTSLDPNTILASQPKGPNGNPILPNGINPKVLPLNSDGTMRLPTVDAWNLTLERQLPFGVVVSAAYVGNKGTHVSPGGVNYNINEPTIVGFGTLNTNQRELFFQKFGWTQGVTYYSDDSTTKYNSLQLRGEKRFSNGLLFQGNFTWASAFDFANDYYLYNPSVDYGPEDGTRRYTFNLNNVYTLPFGKGQKYLSNVSRVGDYVFGGWQISGVWFWGSGLPFTPSYSNCGSDKDTGPCRPNLVGNASVSNPNASEWFAVAPTVLATNGAISGPWERPMAGTFGTVARNSFFGPSYFNFDAALNKNFRITERISGQFRAELYNAFNHVNLGQPDSSVDSLTAGQITRLAGLTQMRQWQFGLRLAW